MVTSNIRDTYMNSGNLDAIISVTKKQTDFLNKIVLLDGRVNGYVIPDETSVIYTKDAPTPTDYIDKNKNEGLQYIYEFSEEEFSGDIETIGLAQKQFTSIEIGQSKRSSEVAYGTGQFQKGTATDIFTGKEKTLDVNFEDNTLTLFDWENNNGQVTITFKKYYHDFNKVRIGQTVGFVYLKEIIAADLSELFDFSEYGISITDRNIRLRIHYGKDELNKKYVIAAFVYKYGTLQNTLMNTAVIDCEDLTNINFYKMALPQEIDEQEFTRRYSFGNNGEAYPAAIYKGRLCNLFWLNRTAEDEKLSGDVMLSINYKNSTDVKEIETKFYKDEEEQTKSYDGMATVPSLPLINYGSGSYISANWTIKNNVAYVKKAREGDNAYNLGFYYKNYIFSPLITRTYDNKVYYNFTYFANPYALSIVETPTKPILKTLNKPLKITFRIVNTGGAL